MAYCVACGSKLVDDARFCSSCGAPVQPATAMSTPTEAAALEPAAAAAVSPVAEPSPYGGMFAKRHRDRDFRAHVEQALADDILSEAEENQLLAWAQAQGISYQEWAKRFRDLLDRMMIAKVNDGRLPDVTAEASIVLKSGETRTT